MASEAFKEMCIEIWMVADIEELVPSVTVRIVIESQPIIVVKCFTVPAGYTF